MITEQDLKEAIAECEGQKNPSTNTCLKLAAFYTIQDKMFPQNTEPVFYSMQKEAVPMAEKIRYTSDTEFGQLIAGMNTDDIMPIMDELMSTLNVLMPKLYDGVMRKLSPDY